MKYPLKIPKIILRRRIKWTNEKFEYSILEKGGKLIQLLPKKFNENDHLNILSEYNNFWTLVDGKHFSSIN